LVVRGSFISEATCPGVVRNLEPPAVVKSLGGAGVTSINENAVVLGSCNGNVVSSGWGDLFALGLLFFLTALLQVEFHGVDVTSGVDFVAHGGIFDTSVNDEVASINEGEGVP